MSPVRNNTIEFRADLKAFADKIKQDALSAQRILIFELFRRILLRTPVDEGRAVGSWNVSYGQPEGEEGIGAAASMGRLEAANLNRFGIYYISNNVPYIGVLEFGGYPKHPKRGSYVKGEGWVIKSVDGYSRQAPVGMVRVSVAEVEAQVDALIRSGQ